MNAFCPFLSNKQVRAEFNELIEALGSENKAYYYWNENNGYNLDKSPDGDLSESYSQTMFATNGDRKAALKASAETLRIMRDEGATVEDLEASKLFGLKQDDLVFDLDILNAVTSMAEAMGVSIREVNFDRDDALAAANFMRKTIDITANAEDRKNAWNKLPEEVAHWWYKLLSKDSELKQALWEAAKKSEKYKELVEKNYGDYSRFENSDDLFIEEAIGQLIAEAIHKKQETTKEVESFFDKFWNKVKEIISKFIKNEQEVTSFEQAAERILNSDLSDLVDISSLPDTTINPDSKAKFLMLQNRKFTDRIIKAILKSKKLSIEEVTNKLKNDIASKKPKIGKKERSTVDKKIGLVSIDLFCKKFKNGVPLNQPFKFNEIKKLELYIYNYTRELIKNLDEYHGKKSISLVDFLNVLNGVLDSEYLCQFAELGERESTYSWDMIHTYRIGNSFLDELAAHKKIGVWFNDTRFYTLGGQHLHFNTNPFAFGTITYFTDPSTGKQAALIHEIQSDIIEDLSKYYEFLGKEEIILRSFLGEFNPVKYPSTLRQILATETDPDTNITPRLLKKAAKTAYTFYGNVLNNYKINQLQKELESLKFTLAHKNYLKQAFQQIDSEFEDRGITEEEIIFQQEEEFTTIYVNPYIGNIYLFERESKTGHNSNFDKPLSFKQIRARAAFKLAKQLKATDTAKINDVSSKIKKYYVTRSQMNFANSIQKLDYTDLLKICNAHNDFIKTEVSVQEETSFDVDHIPNENFVKNYANILYHHLIQTVIEERGKDFPIYIPGYWATINLQGNVSTAAIYATDIDAKNGYGDTDRNGRINPGIMFTTISKLKGIKLEYVESIPGMKEADSHNPSGYKLDLSNYNYTEPMLFGLKDSDSNPIQEDDQTADEIEVQNQTDQFQKDTNDLKENMDTYVVNRLKEAKRENPNVDPVSVIQAAKSEFIDRQHRELINKTAEILIKSFDLVREVDKDGKVTYRRKNQENNEEKADLIIEFLNYLEDDSAGYYDRNSKSTAAHHVISISLSEGDPSTFSHELAHHYIGMFWKSNLIQTALRAIDRPGMTDEEREEELVELITMKTQDEQFLSGLENNSFRQRFYGKLAYLLSRTFNINNKFTRNGLMTNAARAFMLNQEQQRIDDQNVLFALADGRKHQQSIRRERITKARKLAQKEKQETGYERLGVNDTHNAISNIVRGSIQRNKAFRRESQNQPRILTNMQLAEDEVRQFVEDIKNIREEFKRSIGKQDKKLNQSERTQMSVNPKELKKNVKLIKGFIAKAREELLDLAEKLENMESARYQHYIYRKVINPATGEYEIEYLDETHINDPDVEVVDVTFDELSQILQNTIGFYESIIKDLNLAITNPKFAIDYGIDVRDELLSELEGIQNNPSLAQTEGLNSILRRVQDSYLHTIQDRVEQYIRSTVQEQEGLDDLHKERLIYSMNTWLKDQNVFGDIGVTETWFGLASNSKSPIVRLLQNVIDDMHNRIDIEVQKKGDELVSLRKKARKALKRPGWLPINFEKFMMERDSDGFTGNFATRVNRGKYETEKDKFINKILFEGKDSYQRQVQERIGDKWYEIQFDETGEAIFPQGCDDIEKDYLHKVNHWIGKRTVRQFTTEYYDMRIDMLSSLTRRAQKQYDDKINKLVNAASPNGKFQSELLTKAKREELKRLYEKKQQLSNPYDRYGVLKAVDTDDYIIAKELTAWHNFVKDKIKYKLDRQSFDESLQNAADKDAFVRENTFKMINPVIWEEAKRIYPHNNNIPRLEELIERRRKLISIIKRRGYNYPSIEEIWDVDNKKIRDEYIEFWENLKKLDEEILRIQATLPKPPKNIKAAAAYRALLSTIDVMSPYTKANGRKYPWIEYIEKQITERVNADYANDPNKASILKRELEKVHAVTRINGQLGKEQALSIFSMTGPTGETVKINGQDVQAIIDEPIQAYSVIDIENSDSRYVDTRYDSSSDIKTQLLCEDTKDQITGQKYNIKNDEVDYTNRDFIDKIENGPKEVKDYYDALVSAMKESYERIPFVGKYDGRLPQRGASSQQLLWRNALKGQYFKTSDYQWSKKNRVTRGISATIDFLLKPLRDWAIFNPIRALRYNIARNWGSPNETDEDINLDYETRPDGTRSMNVPIRYIQRIPDPTQINSDVLGGVMSFYQMSLNYKEKTDKLSLFNTVLARLDSNVSNNTRQRSMVRGMINRQFYDRLRNFDTDEKNLAVYTSETVKWLLKVIPGLKALTQTGLLSLGWLAGIVAYLDPLIQFTVDGLQGKYIDVSDYIAGNLTVIFNMFNALRGLGSSRAYGFVPSGMRYFGLSRPGASNFQRMNRTQLGRLFNLNLLMSPFSLGEYTIKAQTFGSVMHSYRYYKKDGEAVGKFYNKKEFIEEMSKNGIMTSTQAAKYFNINLQFETLYKAYHTDFKTGEFSRANNKYGQAITDEFENQLKKRMKNRATNYNYIVPETERTKIQSNILLSFITVMRTFMLVGFAERLRSGNDFQMPYEIIADESKQANIRKQLKKEYYADKGMHNFQTGEIENGTFNGFFSVLFRHQGRYLKYLWYNMHHPFQNRYVDHFVDKREELQISDTDLYGFNRTFTEILAIAFLAACQVVFQNSMDDDDKKDYWMQVINHILLRIAIERMTFMNPNTLLELINSVTPSKSDIDRKFKLFNLIQDAFVGFKEHGTKFDEWEKVKGQSAYKGKPVAFRDLMQTLSSLGAHNLYTSSDVAGVRNKTKWYKPLAIWKGFWNDDTTTPNQTYPSSSQSGFGGGFSGGFGGGGFGGGF